MAYDSKNTKWSDSTVSINGVVVKRITRVVELLEREVEEIYGAGDEVEDVVPGNKKHGVRITVKRGVVEAMNRAAAKVVPGGDLTDVPWVISSTYKQTLLDPKSSIVFGKALSVGYEDAMENNAKSGDVELVFKCLAPVRS